jgi:hypothetical protein
VIHLFPSLSLVVRRSAKLIVSNHEAGKIKVLKHQNLGLRDVFLENSQASSRDAGFACSPAPRDEERG